jgi:hypothetical protein
MDSKHAPEVTSVTQYMEAACCSGKSENDIELMKQFSEQFQLYKPENMYQQIKIFASTLKVILKEFRPI